ncbi:hypothetical protein FN846DRAFT_885718 [Sphaerosporella brunnea]|uniref:Uncharacterized protein n=1 Tax=Sphaerosporella brunnea TaxID=1250544 RepID=A0A5J5FCC2_9PEZI|nr:hypothetical protein FN846DRAFT_885718 [Sphaerosporella brunnea]
MSPRKKENVSPADAAAARLTAFVNKPQPPSTIARARDVVGFDELMDMSMRLMDQRNTRDGPHAVWDRADDAHQLTTETPNEDDGQRATQTMNDAVQDRIGLVADGQENKSNVIPRVRQGVAQPTADHSQHDNTEELDDDGIASPPLLSPGFIGNLCAMSLRRVSDHTFEQVMASYTATLKELPPKCQ